MNLGCAEYGPRVTNAASPSYDELHYVRKHNFHTVLDLNMVMSTFVVGYAVPTLVYEFWVVLVVLRITISIAYRSDQQGQISRQ